MTEMYYNDSIGMYSSDPYREYNSFEGWRKVPIEQYETWVNKLLRLADLFQEEDDNLVNYY